MGGMVLETNMMEILTRIEEQNKLEKEEVSPMKQSIAIDSILNFQAGISAAPSKALSKVKNMNLGQQLKDIKLPEMIKDLKISGSSDRGSGFS